MPLKVSQSTSLLKINRTAKTLKFSTGGLNPNDVPQMVTITFDDAVNDENWKLYTDKLFPASAKNPNGCPIHATFFVSHEYTNYAMVSRDWLKARSRHLVQNNRN